MPYTQTSTQGLARWSVKQTFRMLESWGRSCWGRAAQRTHSHPPQTRTCSYCAHDLKGMCTWGGHVARRKLASNALFRKCLVWSALQHITPQHHTRGSTLHPVLPRLLAGAVIRPGCSDAPWRGLMPLLWILAQWCCGPLARWYVCQLGVCVCCYTPAHSCTVCTSTTVCGSNSLWQADFCSDRRVKGKSYSVEERISTHW